MKTTVLILSGGLDSTTLLYHLLAYHEVKCLSIDYGQRHRREIDAAAMICHNLGIEHRVADFRSLKPLLGGSSQTDDAVAVPHGHYAEESMKLTIVPNRNMLMLAAATAWAISLKYDSVAYAAHAGDHAVYPDCREEFCSPLAEAMKQADWHPVQLDRPFLTKTKAEIVALGIALGVPYQDTWTCYEGGEISCGRCGTCVERLESFAANNAIDPLPYIDREFWKTCAKKG